MSCKKDAMYTELWCIARADSAKRIQWQTSETQKNERDHAQCTHRIIFM